MASRAWINTVLAIACVASISILTSALYQRRKQKRKQAEAAASCRCCGLYLQNKPQYSFKRVLADNSYTPFKHLKLEGKEKEISLKLHPYEYEISLLLENPPSLPSFSSDQKHLEVSTSYLWVCTQHQLESLAEILSREHVFAVDTEQHSLHSFLGFTALMQISTQKEDFLLDTIALHDSMSILRPVFANPSICKVFHGSDNDNLWLQRDFHIYIVNLFDTAKACEVLSKPHKSLAYLLETYCGVATNKTLQREDWRIRPLSSEMVQYARTDAHYLLYIANCLACELKRESLACHGDELNFTLEAIRRSNMVCMQLYVKENESPPGDSAASSIYSRYSNVKGGFWENCPSRELVGRLCTWRDIMARMHDECPRYVLSDQAIFALTVNLPKTPTEICDVILHADLSTDPVSTHSSPPSPSPFVKGHFEDICFLIDELPCNPDDVFRKILQRHLDPTGSCPLSIYNFSLLSELNSKLTSIFYSKQNGGKFTASVGRKASRELFVQKFSCKSPVYHNCRIYAADGRLLCYCDRRKIEWYLRRDLAKIVDNDPLAIMLLFEPKGRPEDEDNDFYIHSKKNMCVGCGEKNHYLRYRIIPSCYRVHFPEHLKSHRSHDIVLLCVDCHEIAHSAAEKYKRQIAAEYEIPLFIRKVVDSGENNIMTVTSDFVEGLEEVGVSPLQLRTAAMALLRHGSKMPPTRHEELIQIVKLYFGGGEVTKQDLETALVVGMNPQERRRLVKKRGFSFRSQEESTLNRTITYACAETSLSHIQISQSGEFFSEDPKCIKSEGANLPKNMCHDERNAFASFDLVVDSLSNGGVSINSGIEKDSIKERIAEQDNFCSLKTGDEDENRDSSAENGRSCFPSKSDHIVSRKYSKKLSLLGHGPHGKQVVDYLLKEFGEDAILQFCQRWRQVFVDAVHPRFLPSGWDVNHSGRRDFGEYSVYNPSKKTTAIV